ncbi:mannan endo-1,4-beta-mannosidase 2-like protein [Tanacetum coccineum]
MIGALKKESMDRFFDYHGNKDYTNDCYQLKRHLKMALESGMDNFVVDGKLFYVNGWNSYWFMDHAVHDHSRPRIRAMLQAAAKMGLTVCRTWAFNDGDYNALQVTPGQFDEKTFKVLDVLQNLLCFNLIMNMCFVLVYFLILLSGHEILDTLFKESF